MYIVLLAIGVAASTSVALAAPSTAAALISVSVGVLLLALLWSVLVPDGQVVYICGLIVSLLLSMLAGFSTSQVGVELIAAGLVACTNAGFLVWRFRGEGMPGIERRGEPSIRNFPATLWRHVARTRWMLYLIASLIGITLVALWVASFVLDSALLLYAAWIMFGPLGFVIADILNERDARRRTSRRGSGTGGSD